VSERSRTTVSVGELHPGLTRGGICVPPTVTYSVLAVPRFRLNTNYGREAFSVACWSEALADFVRDQRGLFYASSQNALVCANAPSALGVLNEL